MFKPVMQYIVLAILALALTLPGTVFAAVNFATGDISGAPGSLTRAPDVTINAQQLALAKRAFYNGSWLADGTTLPRGSKVHFMIYVDNKTAITVADINMADALTGFTYNPILTGGLLRADNSVASCTLAACSQAEEEDVYAAAIATLNLLEAVDGTDVAGVTGATVSVGLSAGNSQLDINPTAVWAIVFEATLD